MTPVAVATAFVGTKAAGVPKAGAPGGGALLVAEALVVAVGDGASAGVITGVVTALLTVTVAAELRRPRVEPPLEAWPGGVWGKREGEVGGERGKRVGLETRVEQCGEACRMGEKEEHGGRKGHL